MRRRPQLKIRFDSALLPIPFTRRLGVAFLLLWGCAQEPAPTGESSHAVAGGITTTDMPAAVLIKVPLDGPDALFLTCSGALVGRRAVLTSAWCLDDVMSAFAGDYPPEWISVLFGSSRDDPAAVWIRVSNLYLHRKYQPPAGYAEPITGDIGLLQLEANAPSEIDPLPFADTPVGQDLVDETLRFVAFGALDSMYAGLGQKRAAFLPVVSVEDTYLMAGDSSNTMCASDAGGPLFGTDGSTIVATASNYASGCDEPGYFTRADTYATDIAAVVDAWEGPCKLDGQCVLECPRTPDPDCDPCGFDGVCASGCVGGDLDCPPGAPIGEFCDEDDDCEDRMCVPAADDPRIEYCSAECDPELSAVETCGTPTMTCVEVDGLYTCRYLGTTPGAQGASCRSGYDCRGGICDPDDQICAEPCGDGLQACADGYDCLPLGEQTACRIPSSGGGGCTASPAGDPSRGGLSCVVALIAAALVAGSLRLRSRSRLDVR